MSQTSNQNRVPVIAPDGEPLTPCRPSRARQMVDEGRATPHWNRGIWCIRLKEEPSGRETPDVVCGVDPGSKMEGFSVKSYNTTYVNVQAKAREGVKEKVKKRRQSRRHRRKRKCPYRKPRSNRSWSGLPPSTKARWQWKLRVCSWLSDLYPISMFVIEDVKASSKDNEKKWNQNFSPVQIGKNWFYRELLELAEVKKVRGYHTGLLRDKYGLSKSSEKTDIHFNTHCVDSWVLSANEVGGDIPDNRSILYLKPYNFYRRQLHVQCPSEGGVRERKGGTRYLGQTKGSLVKHEREDRYPSHGLCIVKGFYKSGDEMRIRLKDINTKTLVTVKARPEHCTHKAFLSWNFSWR